MVSVLYREPKLLKLKVVTHPDIHHRRVSVLYREPKLLKLTVTHFDAVPTLRFSALP